MGIFDFLKKKTSVDAQEPGADFALLSYKYGLQWSMELFPEESKASKVPMGRILVPGTRGTY